MRYYWTIRRSYHDKESENDDTDSDAGANGRTADVIIIIGDTLTLDAGIFLYVSSHVDVTEQEADDMIDTNPNLIIIVVIGTHTTLPELCFGL